MGEKFKEKVVDKREQAEGVWIHVVYRERDGYLVWDRLNREGVSSFDSKADAKAHIQRLASKSSEAEDHSDFRFDVVAVPFGAISERLVLKEDD